MAKSPFRCCRIIGSSKRFRSALQAAFLQLEPDSVLAEMLRSMHLIVAELNAPFEPESGAYAHADTVAGAHHGHDHGHGHDH